MSQVHALLVVKVLHIQPSPDLFYPDVFNQFPYTEMGYSNVNSAAALLLQICTGSVPIIKKGSFAVHGTQQVPLYEILLVQYMWHKL